MFCGTASFSHDEDARTAPSTLKESRRKRDKNPYAAQGLDKFSSVLAELEARRKEILASAGGAPDESLVRFMQSSSQDWVPIIVRLPADRKQDKPKPADAKKKPIRPSPENQKSSEATKASSVTEKDKVEVKKSFSWSAREEWRPSYYWPIVMVLLLLSLVSFGRVFAICCTSIWWYLMPTMQRGSANHHHRRSFIKKDYGKRLSDKRVGVNH